MDLIDLAPAGTAPPHLKDTMRITDVTLELVDLPAQPPFRWRAGLPGSEGAAVGGILRIHTDEGLTGRGAHPPRTASWPISSTAGSART